MKIPVGHTEIYMHAKKYIYISMQKLNKQTQKGKTKVPVCNLWGYM